VLAADTQKLLAFKIKIYIFLAVHSIYLGKASENVDLWFQSAIPWFFKVYVEQSFN
jgi:hypothetical protein